ncbi:MAG: putative membrane protein [Arcticibacterium sp.]|jgi:uncharacterized membrane protein
MSNLDLIKKSQSLMKDHWLIAILLIIVYSIISSIPNRIDDSLSIIQLFLGGAFALGMSIYFLNIVRGGDARVENLFDGFKKYVPSLVAYVVLIVLTVLGFILLIIPGIIIICGLSQTFYILADDKTNMSGIDALKKSWEMMDGWKVKYFLLKLIHGGMVIVGLLMLVIGIFYMIPIISTSQALFYEKLKAGGLSPA